MKLLPKTSTLLGLAITFVVIVCLAYTFLFSAMKKKTEATATLSARSWEISGKETKTLSLGAVLKSESVNIEKLSSYFITENDIVSFARKIEELGPQSGTILAIESLDPGLTEKTIPVLNFRIRAVGSFENNIRLLTLLENFPGKFEWRTVRLVRSDMPQQQEVGAVLKGATAPEWRSEVFLTALNFTKE